VKAFGRKLKRGLKSAGEFFYEVLSCFSPENIRETDRLLYEMSNPFTLKDYEILITKDPQELLILESLRKKAEIPATGQVGSGFTYVKFESRKLEHEPYTDDEVNLNER